ncbi:cobyrinic acid a,c-diamide synthase [Moraxella macacae 0408225]|uniref:Cobyrinic acid a,c-diamide synthase n=1 Tax=Moraxella macacae 0408225 TaxID=1230338 RepID=L2F5W1_9GAMM|nr:ParA family protein [Moraxella macacae]ELA08151.1 cobyrinic acid a,c-diamide synthase [Moraxella macacae 0408225]
MDILAIANQKGGVGKTTTAVNLAGALAKKRKKVLLIDLDAQGNATTASGLDKRELNHNIADVLLDDIPLFDAIVKSSAGYDVVGANGDLSGIDLSLSQLDNNHALLATAIQALKMQMQTQNLAKNSRIQKNYDFVVIDCAPSLSLLTINAMCATNGVIIPMQCEYFALEGLADLSLTIERLTELNPNLHIRGVLRTMFDSRNTLANDVSRELKQHFGDILFNTIIPRNIRLAEAPAYGMSVLDYESGSTGAYAYTKLANEIIKQNQQV